MYLDQFKNPGHRKDRLRQKIVDPQIL
jgi:hypothetical protein